MKKILLVNNDFDTMGLLKNWLEKKSYKVKYTGKSNAVISLLEEFPADIILVDLLQQDVIESLNNNTKTAHIPILLMTGHTLNPVNKLLKINDTIEKPFNLSLLLQKIEKLTSEHSNVKIEL